MVHRVFGFRGEMSRCAHIYAPLALVNREAALVALTHPACFANIARRRFGDNEAIEAERAMLRAAKVLIA